MSNTQTPAQTSAVVPATPSQILRPDVAETYELMIQAVPEAGQDGMANILDQIARAGSVQALDAPWQGGGFQLFRDRLVHVHDIRRMPSDFDGPLGFFLVVDGADASTGETFTATTGSIAVVGQLVKAYVSGWFPLACIPRMAKRPTPDGYYPMHLEIARQQPKAGA